MLTDLEWLAKSLRGFAGVARKQAIKELEWSAPYEKASEKMQAYRIALDGFVSRDPEKWEIIRQLRYVDFSDAEDENVRDLVEVNSQTVQRVAGLYRDAAKEGTIRPDIDFLPAVIFIYQTSIFSIDPSPLVSALLQANGIGPERWYNASDDLLNKATYRIPPDNSFKNGTGASSKKRRSP